MRLTTLAVLLLLAGQCLATVTGTTTFTTGSTLKLVIQKIDGGVLGDFWDDTNQAFIGARDGTEEIVMTEADGQYIATTSSALGTYTGEALASVWDDTNSVYLGTARIYIASGVEIVEGRTVSAKTIAKSRTWKIGREGSTASNLITLTANDSVTLAMDFSSALNAGTTISAAVSALDVGGGGLTPTNVVVSQDKKAIHFDITGLSAATTYTIRVIATTTDSQTISADGKIKTR